jgi:hypothetical protein
MRKAGIVLLLVGCGSSGDRPATVGTVETVEAWSLEGPLLDVVDERIVRISSALRTRNGFVITDLRAGEIHFFDPQGDYRSSFGGTGDGPTEFRSMGIPQLMGDTLLVYDGTRHRLSLLSLDGSLLGHRRVETPFGWGFMGVVDTLLVMFSWPGVSRTPGGHRDSLPLLYYSMDGDSVGAPGGYVGSERYVGPDREWTVLPALWWQSTASAGDLLYVGSTDRSTIDAYGPEGLRFTLDTGIVPRPSTQEDVDRHIEGRVADMPPEGKEVWRSRYRAPDRPEFVPTFRRLRADRVGRVWLQGFESQTWTAYNREGALFKTTMPDGFTPTDMGGDYVLGVWLDDLDVGHLRLYDLVPPR